jgi:hypothetical protein
MTDFDSERVTIRNPGREVIRQFVIHTENKVGWLNDMQSKLNAADWPSDLRTKVWPSTS